MKRIKIAQVITRLDWGGSPDIVRIICSYLDPKLYDVTLITGLTKYPSSKTKQFLQEFNSRVVIVPQLKRKINLWLDFRALLTLYFLFWRQKFDIVHTHTAKAGALGRLAAYFAKTKVIIHTPHGHNFYGYFNFLFSKIIIMLEKFFASFTDELIALTELEKKDLIRFKVASPEKIRLIYQGLELEDYAKINIDRNKFRQSFNISLGQSVVGMIGRLEPVKGPQYFVQAVKFYAGQLNNAKFIIAGEGSLRKRLEKQVKNAGLEDRFIFIGWREDIREIISILDILVLPSLNEAVGMVLLEAASLGIPVIATNVGGIPEIVKDKQTGILVEPANYRALALAINYLLSNKQKSLEMSQAAKSWVRGRFKTQDMVNEISKLYQEQLLSEK